MTARGNGRQDVFLDDGDRRHFVDRLAELPERFGMRVHAWVLMDNHYHLLLETPEANLSRGCQWLNVAYSVWFNRRHQRSGHLFQGRFKSVVIGDEGAWSAVARYVHLNPVRVAGLRLGKGDRARQKTSGAREPEADLIRERLGRLREHRWSSYPAYAGLVPTPGWLTTDELLKALGGRTTRTCRRSFREYHEQPLREGRLESVWDGLVAGAILGSEDFVASLRPRLRELPSEVSQAATWRSRVGWETIVKAVEAEWGEAWEAFRDRHGDLGRDVALYVGRRQGRMSLRELGEKAGGLGVAATGQAVSRVGRQRNEDADLAGRIRRIESSLSKSKM